MKYRVITSHDRKGENEIFFVILKNTFWYRMLLTVLISYALLAYYILVYRQATIFIVAYGLFCLYLPFHVYVVRWMWVRKKEREGQLPKDTEIIFYDSYLEWRDLKSDMAMSIPYAKIKTIRSTKCYYALSTGESSYIIDKEAVPEDERDDFRCFLTSIVKKTD